MDGSYGNVFPNNGPMSPMTPSSSGGDAYKVNVTRKKTKKWAEFKPQNYDGDDWGTDYDDGHEEPPPMPKPMGPRQPVPPPPHLRQFQPSGAPPLQTSTQQPVRPTETGSPFTSAPQTTGNAPGRINIDSAATGSSIYSPGPGFPQQGGSSSGSGTPLRRLSPAPPSAGPQSVPSRFPPRKSSMGQSDAPDTAELMRQSRSNTNNNNSRPGSSHKPWVEPRSASPANSAKSPVSPSSGKPLPFIRPADIYRRIPEEKEKERRSMESSRPSMDSISSRGLGLERVDSAPKAAPSPTPEGGLIADHRRSSGAGSTLGPEQETEIRRGSRPSLPPVAERKSEYGLDGLLDSYGFTSDPPRVEPASTSSAPAAQTDSQTQDPTAGSVGSGPAPPSAPSLSSHAHTPTPASAPAPAPSFANQYQQPIDEQEQPQPAVTSQDDLRRISVSPKLPDLSRMSAFGDDLFSTASRYSTVFPAGTPSAPSHLPAIQDSPPPSASEQVPPPVVSMASPRTPSDDKVPTIVKDGDQQPSPTNPQPTHSSVLDSVQTPSKDSSEPGTSTHPVDAGLTLNSKTDQEETSPTSDHLNSPSSTTAPSASAVSDQPPASIAPPLESSSFSVDKQAQPPRPSLPGAWVSETPTTSADLPTPTPVASSLPVVDRPASSSEASPVTESGNLASEAVGQLTPKLPTEVTTNTNNPQPLASLHILPPLRTGSPALSLSPRGSTEIPQTEKQDSKGPSSTESDWTPELTSRAANTASTTRDFTPTAPLNPSRAPREDFTTEESKMGQHNTVPSSDAGSTLDTTGGSPLKESDKLREEIIKSLSPIQGSGNLPETTAQSTAAYHTAAGPGRESSYLSGVYDDYWAAGDDNLKSELQLDESLTQKEQEPEKWDRPQDQAKVETFPPAPSYPAPVPASTANVAEEMLPSPQQQIVTNAPARPLRRRFSWEAEPEVIESPVTAPEPKSLGSDHQPVVVATATPALTEPMDAGHLAPAVPKSDLLPPAEQPQAGGISHQVSGASTIPPRSTLDAPIDPPSPVSVLSERVGLDSKSRRLSLAEEKAGVHSSSHPVSPTPPLDEHPALADGASAFPTPAPAPAPAKREPVNLNLVPFRQIMELPSPEERIKRFAETRAEYAMIDSGLEEWLIEMKNRHPEYANATGSFRPTTAHQSSAHNPGQGPFSGDITEGGLPPNTMPMPPHPIHGHAHNQVGTKSKELLMAAGKAGKGLFSKGKNKLRGTGDKDFEPQAALAAAPIRQSWSPTAAAGAPAGSVNQQLGRFGAGETPLDVQAPLTRTSQSASTPTTTTTPLVTPVGGAAANKLTKSSTPKKGDRRTSWAFSLGFRSSRSDLAARPASVAAAPNLLSPASASSVSLSLSGSGSAQQATRIRPLSTQALQVAQPQLWAGASARSSYQGPRPQFGPSAPPPQPPLNSPEKSWGASSPPLSSTSFHPSQLPFARNNSRSQGGRPSSAPLPPLPRTSTPVNQVAHGKNNSIDCSIVLPALDSSSPSRQRRDSQVEVELVSPVSDTFSHRPTPAPYERELSDSLRIPAPISKEQPSWDPYTGTPLVEEEDFNLEAPGVTATVVSSAQVPSLVAAVAANNGPRTTLAQAAHMTPSHLSSQERQDDTSRCSNVIAADQFHLTDKDVADRDKGPAQQHQQQQNIQGQDTHSQRDEMAAYAQNSSLPTLPPSANNYSQHPFNPHNAFLHHQQPQQQPQSQADPNAPPQRQSSFVGLPPIPREPGLGESLLNFPSDRGNGESSPSQQQYQQQPPPHQQQQQQQQVQPLGAAQAQFVSMSAGQPQLVHHNVYRPTQPQPQGFPTPPPGVSNQQWTLRPQGAVPGGQGGQQRSFSGPPTNAPPSMMLNGGAQQIYMGQGPQQATSRPPMLPPPHMVPRGGFQPQSGWTVQESHLTEPLHSPNRHRSSASNTSSHQPVYGFDKETGVSSSGPSGRDADEDADPPSGPSAATAAQSQQQASQPQPPPPPPSQVSPASPPGPNAAAPGMPSPEPDQSDLVPPGPIPAVADEARAARRSSGVFGGFGGLKERLTGLSADERPGSATGPRFQGATGDAVSDASVATDNGQKKRGLFGLRSSGTGFDNQPPRSKESMIAHGPGTPSNGERDQPGPSQYPPPEKKRSGFLGLGGASGSAPPSKLVNSHTPRPSVSSTTPSENPQAAGSVGGPPKKRFSALTGKFHHKSAPGVQEGLKPPGTAQSSHSTIQGQPQPPQSSPGQQQHQQPVQANGPPGAAMDGRERSESNATTRPLTAQQIGSNPNPNPMHQKPTTPNPEAKKGGGLFGRLMHREAKPAAAPAPAPAPGQPLMNQLQTNPGQGQMGRGQQPFPQGPGGPQPQFLGAPGQPGLQQPGPFYLQVQGPDGKIMTQPFIHVQTPDGRLMLQPVQIVQRPGPPGQPPQMVMLPQNMPMMGPGQPQVNPPQGALQPNGQPGGQAQGLPGQSTQLPPQQIQNQPPPHMQVPPQTPAQVQGLGQQQLGSPSGLQQPPAPQQQAQNSLLGPGRERGNSVASPPSGAGSPQIGSSVSPQTQSLASPPADASRSQNASPVSVRQPIPVPPPGSIQGTPPQALRQPSSPTPPITQSFARKPVSSSPKPSAEQFRPPPAPGSNAGPPGDRAAALAAQIQPSPLGQLQGPPAPPAGASPEQQPRVSHSPIPQPPPGTPAQMLPQRLPPQQSSPGGAVNRIPQPVPVPLPTPTPQPAAQNQQNNLLQPPNQPSPPVSASSPREGNPTPAQGQPDSEVSRVPSHGSTPGPTPTPSMQANQQAQTNVGPLGPIKEQSTFSKILKGALPTEPAIGQEKPGKEKSKSSFFSAFRGRSKQSEVQDQPQPQPQPQPQTQQAQAQPGQSTQQGGPQGQLGQKRPSMSPLQSNPTGLQGQGRGQPGPHAQYQHQRQSPSGSASPDGNQAAQKPAPQPTPVPNQGPPQQQQQPQSTQAQQGPTGLRQPGQQMPPPAMGRGGPQGPPPNQNQNRGPAEPQQYPSVPIPQGYRPVHAEGNVGAPPAPYFVGAPGGMPRQPPFRPMPGQFAPPGMHQQQPWLQQNVMARQIQPVPLPGQQHPMYQQGPPHGQPGGPHGQNLPQGAQGQPMGPPGSVLLPQQRQQLQQQQPQPQGGPGQQQGLPQPVPQQFSQAQNSLPSAENSPHPSGVSPTPIATPGGLSPVSASPPPTVLNAAPPPQNQFQPRPIPSGPGGLVTSVTGPQPGQPQPAMSPQNYPLPNTAFSPVNPAAGGMPNPPLPLGSHPGPYPQGQFLNNGGVVPQRQVSAVSAVSMQPENHPHSLHGQNTISPVSHALPGQQSQNATPSPQITPDRAVSPEPQVPVGGANQPNHLVIDSRTVSPEPPSQSLAPPPVTTPRSNRQVDEDNIYDATPRQSMLPQSRQVQNSIAGNVVENAETSSPGPYNEVANPTVVLAPPPLQIHHHQQQQQHQQHQQQYEQHSQQQQLHQQQQYEQQAQQQHIIVQSPPLQPQPPQQQLQPQIQIQSEPQPQPPRPQAQPQAAPRERELPPPQPVSEPSSPAPAKATLASNSTDGKDTNGDGNMDGPQEPRPPPVTHINGKPITSSADIFNEEKRKMLIREQEEKIPVFPEEPDMNLAALAAAKKKEQEELPQMSATSYPGQEWNPYGDGGFDDSDGEGR